MRSGEIKKHARRHEMLHDKYEDFDPEYTSKIFRARKALVGSIEGTTLLPQNDLKARSLLNGMQMEVVKKIRQKRLEPVLNRFVPD